MTRCEIASPLSPALLHRTPPILGWRLQLPPDDGLVVDDRDEDRRHELQAELLQLDAGQGRIAQMRRRLSSRRADARLWYGGLRGAACWALLHHHLWWSPRCCSTSVSTSCSCVTARTP